VGTEDASLKDDFISLTQAPKKTSNTEEKRKLRTWKETGGTVLFDSLCDSLCPLW
jgi:hypothetical protein